MNLIEYFNNGVDFNTYVTDIEDIVNKGDKNDNMYQYYSLNLQRINRLSKKVQLSQEQITKLEKVDKNFKLIVITEGWCGDAAQIIPVIQKIQEQTNSVETKMVYRDQNLDLMNQYLTNGSMSIPIVVGVNEAGEEAFRWGPRPAWAADFLQQYKSGELTKEEFLLNLQKTYNKDKGKSIIDELLNLMI